MKLAPELIPEPRWTISAARLPGRKSKPGVKSALMLWQQPEGHALASSQLTTLA
jgi:hypothetical protein